jgi:hypothetical protein
MLMTYDHKIAIVVRNDLASWQKLNMAAFLASAVAIQFSETHGNSFINASGSTYLPFIKHPVLIYKADSAEQLKRAFTRAKERAIHIGIYTDPLFNTKDEEGNHIEIGKYTDDTQILAGIVLYGENKKVDKALDGLRFHN